MEALPNEILCMIIGLLNKNDLLLVRLVNKIWQFYAEDYLKAIYFSVKTDEDVSQLIKLTSWRCSEKTTLPYVRFNFNISLKMSNENLEEFISKYGKVIQGLRYKIVRPQANEYKDIYKLLMNTPNIQEVHCPPFMNCSVSCFSLFMLQIHNIYELNFPKLISFGFWLSDKTVNMLKHILNTSPNVKKIDLGVSTYNILHLTGNFQDFISIFYLISSKNIELKLNMTITTSEFVAYGFDLQSFKEIVKVHLIITDLTLRVYRSKDSDMANVAKLQGCIEEFMHKLSGNLKHLKVFYDTGEKKILFLHFKHMKKLETLEFDRKDMYIWYNKTEGNLTEVKLGFAPLLKKITLHKTMLNLQLPVTPLKHLYISSNKIFDCLHSLQLLDKKFRLETLSVVYLKNYEEDNNENVFTQKCIQQLTSILIYQATNIKELIIRADSGDNYELKLPKMENLQRLELASMPGPKVKLEQLHFPDLQILYLSIPFQANHNESMDNVHTLTITTTSIPDFVKTTLKFPNLRKLFIRKWGDRNISTTEFFRIIFKNSTHIKELEYNPSEDWNELTVWNELTGNSEVVDFLTETSTATTWTLNTCIPNLGDLTALENLELGCSYRGEHMKAVAYLILCGKLTNLKYFDAFSLMDKESISSLTKIFESNNTKINFRSRL